MNMYSNKKILECSSEGNDDFSAFKAEVNVNGKLDTIERHYQRAKVFRSKTGALCTYNSFKKTKSAVPIAFLISGYCLPLEYGAMFYDLMWYKYIKANPELEEILEQYDDYTDKFKSKTARNCQADTIRKYMQSKDGTLLKKEDRGKRIINDCEPLLKFLRGETKIAFEYGDIFKGYTTIIGHQTNCKGVMNKGIAETVRKLYPNVYDEFILFSKENKENLLGRAQMVRCRDRYICNIFGQYSFGKDKTVVYTNYDALEKALIELKEFAKKNNLIVGLPYKIGSRLANGNWDKVCEIIERAFKDYYVIIYIYEP